MRRKGTITSWKDDKGYGFVTQLKGGKQVFIHINAFDNRNRRPEINEVVTYTMSKDKQGRPSAANAMLAGDKLKRKTAQKGRSIAFVFALAFLFAVGGPATTEALPSIILVTYVALSLITFLVYAIDKSRARRGRWRISEGTLHLLALAGGWPGALIAQQTLRHKSKKASFRIVFWATVLLNCGGLIWLHTIEGRAYLNLLLARIS